MISLVDFGLTNVSLGGFELKVQGCVVHGSPLNKITLVVQASVPAGKTLHRAGLLG